MSRLRPDSLTAAGGDSQNPRVREEDEDHREKNDVQQQEYGKSHGALALQRADGRVTEESVQSQVTL